jgi:acetoin utilization deacetylase AcuC-like enzyme
VTTGTGIVWDERYGWHDAGPWLLGEMVEPVPAPDTPDGKRRIWSLLEVSGITADLVRIPARQASDVELLRVHPREHLDHLRQVSERGGGAVGVSAWVGADGFPILTLAAGGALAAVDAVLENKVRRVYALIRPAGHHANGTTSSGFCLLSNTAIAAAHARASGLDRVAVVDFDVHHGNGTQDIFYADPAVLTISLHQDGNYPADTGGLDERGEEAGRGANLNLPLPPGSGHGAYLAAMERVVLPALERFRPDLVLIAAGWDACLRDPLGRMLLHSDSYRQMVSMLVAGADRLSDGRLVMINEGGYSPLYAPFCALAAVEALSGRASGVSDPMLERYMSLPGQELEAHQAALIARGQEALRDIPA